MAPLVPIGQTTARCLTLPALPAHTPPATMAEVQALTSGPLVPALLPESLDDKYRGAVVEVGDCIPSECQPTAAHPYPQDLQLPPAFALHHEARVLQAIELAYDRDFSQIP